jgi:hypothetical protein
MEIILTLRPCLFRRKIFSGKCFPYFLVFDAMENDVQNENIFGLTRKASLIFGKWFPFFNIINHFSSLSFSFLHTFSLIVYSPPPPEVSRDRWPLPKVA